MISSCKYLIKSLFILAVLITSLPAYSQTLGDIKKIKSKLYDLSLRPAITIDAVSINTDVDQTLKTIGTNGDWPDIDYQDKTNSKWQPAQHWQRLLLLATNYRREGSPYFGDMKVRSSILKGIGYWLQNTPKAANYWWNAMGVPTCMGSVLVLMEKDIDRETLTRAVKLMMLGIKPDYYDYYGRATGQNLLWLAGVHLYISCLTDDIEGLKRVFRSVNKEISISSEDGLQSDFSFYQHGRQNYALGYGKVFAASAIQFFYLANGTDLQFAPEKIALISHYLLDGQQWMTRYDQPEYTAMGREISRKDFTMKQLLAAIKLMEIIDPTKKTDYDAFYKRLSGFMTEPALNGNRYFWRSDLMIQQRPDYYFSIKGASNRIKSGESGNGENIKGFYQGNGTYYLLRSGKEYNGLFPLWDWRKIPGLLAKQSSAALPLFTWGEGAQGATSFVYGLSDGKYGCFGYDYQKDQVKARRAWFMFNREIVYLANSIQGDSLYQSINQCRLAGPVWRSSPSVKYGEEVKILQDSIGYCIDGNLKISLDTSMKTGAWHDINLAASNAPISAKLFSLGVDLGPKITEGSLSYTILPAVSLPEFKNYRLSDHITKLQNSHELQAVYQRDLEQVQAIFYTPGKITLPWNGVTITLKKAGLLMVKKNGSKLLIDYCQPSEHKHAEYTENSTGFQNEDISVSKANAGMKR